MSVKRTCGGLIQRLAREGEMHGRVIIEGACSICDREVYGVIDAEVLDKRTKEELSGKEVELAPS